MEKEKTFSTTLLLCLFLGCIGTHRFYTGYVGLGILFVILCITGIGLPIAAIWALIDLIAILMQKYKTAKGQEIKSDKVQALLENKIIKSVIMTIIAVAVFIAIMLLIATIAALYTNTNEAANVETMPPKDTVSVSLLGDKYPYTIDNLKLKCENDAVWVITPNNDLYALNGLASVKLQNNPYYKGYTTEIQKDDIENSTSDLKLKVSDFDVLQMGFDLCKKKN